MTPDRLVNIEKCAFAVETISIPGNRGPCGGVWKIFKQLDVALDALRSEKIPLYINWNPVNNIPVTAEYERQGLVNFKNDWNLVPRHSLVIPSAHGVGPDFYDKARGKECVVVADGTCQLVTRVHELVKKAQREGMFIVYIGKEGHPETVGVMSEVEAENIALLEEDDDVSNFEVPFDRPKIVYSQTTLSTNEIRKQYRALRSKFPGIEIPSRWDICYATDSRQTAVEQLIDGAQLLVVVGSGPSHNSNELRLIGQKAGKPSFLIDYASGVKEEWFGQDVSHVVVTSGASVPDYLMNPVVGKIALLNPGAKIVYAPQVVEENLERIFKYDEQAIREIIGQHLSRSHA